MISIAVTIALMRGRTPVLWTGDFHRTGSCPSSGRGKSRGGAEALKSCWPLVKRRLLAMAGEMKPTSPSSMQLKCMTLLHVCLWHWPGFQRAVLQNCGRRRQLSVPTERNPGTETIKVQRSIGLPRAARVSKPIPRFTDAAPLFKIYIEATRNLCVLYFPSKCGILLVSSHEGDLLPESKVYLTSLPRNVYPEVCTSWRPCLALGCDSSRQQ